MTMGVAVVAAPGEPLSKCLGSVAGAVDQIIVFTWDGEQERTGRSFGAEVILIDAIDYVEPVRQRMQAALGTQWVLMLDPDEIVEPAAVAFFRELARAAVDDVVGFWIPYRMMIHDQPLRHSFARLFQLKLYRRNRIKYGADIHQAPLAIDGRFEYVDSNAPGIEHHFVTDLRHRFERHLQWAAIEAKEAVGHGVELVTGDTLFRQGLEELAYYVVLHDGLRDGTVGAVNALMHAWKRVARLCLIWELQGARNQPVRDVEDLEQALRKIGLT